MGYSHKKAMENLDKIVDLETKLLNECRSSGLDYYTYTNCYTACEEARYTCDMETLIQIYNQIYANQGQYLTVMNIDKLTYYFNQLYSILNQILNADDDDERILERDYPRYYDEEDLER